VADDEWSEVGDQFRRLGQRLKGHFEQHVETSQEEAQQALQRLADAVDQGLQSIGSAVRDPGVQDDAKALGRSFADALSASLGKFGERLQPRGDEGDHGTGEGPGSRRRP